LSTTPHGIDLAGTIHLHLARGATPVVMQEAGDFDGGDGMRVTLFPHHLLIEFTNPTREGRLILDLIDILDAMQSFKGEA
jgi:hypothetical protein